MVDVAAYILSSPFYNPRNNPGSLLVTFFFTTVFLWVLCTKCPRQWHSCALSLRMSPHLPWPSGHFQEESEEVLAAALPGQA